MKVEGQGLHLTSLNCRMGLSDLGLVWPGEAVERGTGEGEVALHRLQERLPQSTPFPLPALLLDRPFCSAVFAAVLVQK